MELESTSSSSLYLELEGRGQCFFCLENLKSEQLKSRNSVFPLRSLARYLKLDKRRPGRERRNEAKVEGQSVVTCDICSKLLLKFQKLFELRLETEMKLGTCMGEIRARLAKRKKEKEKRKLSPAAHLRKRLKGKCFAKALAYQPKVALTRTRKDPSELLRDIYFQVKTEPCETEIPNPQDYNNEVFSDHDNSPMPIEPEVEEPPENYPNDHTQPPTGPEPDTRPEPLPFVIRERKPKFDYKIGPDPAQPGSHMCLLCNRSYKQLVKCRQHFRWEHLNHRPDFRCKTCEATFGSYTSLHKHVSVIHMKRTFLCPFCGRSFNTKIEQTSHELLRCQLNPGAGRWREVRCRVCNVELLGKTTKAHFDEEHADLPFPCEECGERFKRKYHLQRHQLVHERPAGWTRSPRDRSKLPQKNFCCEQCGNCYAKRSALRKHVRMEHLGVRFCCPVPECGKEFKERGWLQFHSLTEHPDRHGQKT